MWRLRRGNFAHLKPDEPADFDFVRQLFGHRAHVLFDGDFGILFDEALINLATDQAEFSRIVEAFRKELEFSGSDIVWWPLGKQRQIVVDPKRNFGQPTVARSGVPSQVLVRSLKANASSDLVARWYEVQPEEIRDAVEFEESLAKAA